MAAVKASCPDHIVLRVKDPVASVKWYSANLGLTPVRLQEFQDDKVPFPSVRISPTFLIDFFKQQENDQQQGLPDAGSEARRNTGFDHFCLVVDSPDIEAVRQSLAAQGVEAEQQFDGVVVHRFGAQGNASSIYVRDPDHYVVELRTYAGHAQQQQQAAQHQEQASDPAAAGKPVNESKCDEGSGI